MFSPTNLVGQASASDTEKNPTLPRLGDTRRASMGGKVTPEGIKFGRPSSSSQKASSSGSEWTNLLKQTASGGIASAFTGSFGGIGGLGSLISGIVGLFGGGAKSTLPPLVEFQLPASEQQTVYVSATGNSVYQGNAVQSSGIGGSAGGSQNSGSGPDTYWIQAQSAQIAQSVKTAILNSSSLNDVIAEL
ncbi:MAG: hypothetical protein JOY53_04560 [Acidobacteriaceae bacterium]|nr:hypothetical protein [Acidobacteriaceae bacterium]